MTDKDRALLELAAKAAEMCVVGHNCGLLIRSDGNKAGYRWNPLTDDGDALRLAVKLRLDVTFGFAATQINVSQFDWAEDEDRVGVQEDGREDPYAATRRAIVLAAAEIGMGITHPMVEGLPEDNYDKTQAEAFTLAERERCAKLVEELARKYGHNGLGNWTIASEIRKEPK